ncbi:myb-like protein X isoform X1 [Stegodyphus dumicola]|uniref:myb-like protein X isoform X1 n=1 Tax=Stegodyphus dumicola TaxID=202533 RepID=UPI0015AC1C6F|nr:myb-like protein X isoform X1 [Stegodyphus dumicola]
MAHDWLLRRRKRKSPLPSPKKKLKRFKLSELRKEAEKSSAVSSATEIDLEAKLKKSVADVSADEEKSACSVQKELQSSNTNEKKSEPESGYKRILRSSHRTKADDSSDVQVIDSSSKQSYESVLNNKPILTAEKRKGDETELAVKYKNENKQIRHERENEDVAAPEVQSQKLSSQTTTTSSSVSSDDEPLVIDLSDNDDNDGDNDKSKKQLAAGKETVSIESKTSEQSSEKNKVQKRQYPGVIPLYHQMPLNDDVHTLVAAHHHTLHPQLPANDSSPQKVSNTVQSSSCRQTFNSDINRVVHNPTNLKYDEHLRAEGECTNPKNFKQSVLFPLKSNNNHITSQKHDVEVPLTKVDLLSKAAETARKVFGPCSVQRVHLKNGKTVYAYAPHEVPKLTSNKNSTVTSSHTMPIGLSHSGNNVRNLNDVFHAIDSISKGVACAQTSSVSSVPEEIILDDSDDEVQEITDANSCRTLNVHNSAMESSEHKDTNIELQEHSKISNSNVNL